MKKQHYLDKFYSHFDILPARSLFLIRQAQRLRYQVYCIEAGIKEPPSKSVPFEFDEFDHRSVHSLIRHRSSGLMVATVRLVLARSSQPYGLLPMEKYCRGRPGFSHLRLDHLPRDSLAEVSRFAISKNARYRLAQSAKTHSYKKPSLYIIRQENEYTPYEGLYGGTTFLSRISIGLMAAVVRMSTEGDITHLCAAMEPALVRLLSQFGVYFKPIGPLMDYCGMCLPCVITLDEIMQGMQHKRPGLWEFMVEYAHRHDIPEPDVSHARLQT